MRVGLDVRGLEPGFKSHFGRGTGRYVSELSVALKRNSDVLHNQGVELSEISLSSVEFSNFQNSILDFTPYGKQTLGQQVFLPRKLGALGLDAIHFPSHIDAPTFLKPPTIVTVLDIIPLLFDDLYRADNPNWRFYFARFLENGAIRRAKRVIAISEATKRDITNYFGIEEERVSVTPLGVKADFLAKAALGDDRQIARKQLSEELGLTPECPVILYLGGIDARKNVEFLIDVVDGFQGTTDNPPALIIAGNYREDKNYSSLVARINRSAAKNRIFEVGFVEDSELKKYYTGACCFLFASRYEGFGLPVLEAMAMGLPVVAAKNSSIPEVLGDCGSMIENWEVADWVQEVSSLLANKELLRQLSEMGHKRAQQFSWDNTALKTIQVYKDLKDELHYSE